jgi:hypothetical protein
MTTAATAGAVFIGAAATVYSYPQVAWVGALIDPAWPWTAWLFPFIVDVGLAVAALFVVAWRHGEHRSERRLAWSVVVACALLSWACNAAHAMHSTGATGWLAAAAVLASAVPPFGLVFAPHLAAYALQGRRAAEPSADSRQVVMRSETDQGVMEAVDFAQEPWADAYVTDAGMRWQTVHVEGEPEPEPPTDPDPLPRLTPITEEVATLDHSCLDEPESDLSTDGPDSLTTDDATELGWAIYTRVRLQEGEPPSAGRLLREVGVLSLATWKRRRQEFDKRWETEGQSGLRVVR